MAAVPLFLLGFAVDWATTAAMVLTALKIRGWNAFPQFGLVETAVFAVLGTVAGLVVHRIRTGRWISFSRCARIAVALLCLWPVLLSLGIRIPFLDPVIVSPPRPTVWRIPSSSF